jgi:hypothetical protein
VLKIERQTDLYLSTLRHFVEAAAGALLLRNVFRTRILQENRHRTSTDPSYPKIEFVVRSRCARLDFDGHRRDRRLSQPPLTQGEHNSEIDAENRP